MTIHPTAVVDAKAEIAADAEIGPYCVIDGPVTIGARARLISHVTVTARTTIGEDCLIHPFAALGFAAQDTKYKGEDTELVIGAHTLIREHVTMHRGTTQRWRTEVGEDGYFMVGAHVSHDSILGRGVTFANNVAIGGHSEIGDYAILGGLAAIHQYTRIGRYAFLGGGGILVGDIIPYGSAYGNHASLNGLNLVGLKRRGAPRDAIRALRGAYRILADASLPVAERFDRMESEFPESAEVAEIVSFARAGARRNLCLP